MKTPAVPPANSNNSTLRNFNDEQFDNKGDNDYGIDYPNKSQVDELKNNNKDPYCDIFKVEQEEFEIEQCPHSEEYNVQLSTQIYPLQSIQSENQTNHLQPQTQPQPQPQPQSQTQPQPQSQPQEHPQLESELTDQNDMDIGIAIEHKENNEQIIQIQCKPKEITPLSNQPSIEIKLSFPEKKVEKTGPLTKKKFLSFLITTMPFKYQVRRTYSDFIWLRNTLTDTYKGIFIAPIPIKKTKQSTISIEKMEKRMKHLEHFINSIANDSLLKTSKVFYDFLSISNQADFIKSKTAQDTLNKPNKTNKAKNLIDLTTVYSRSNDNKLRIDKLNAESIIQFEDIKCINKNTQIELTRLNKAFHMLFIEMKQVSDRYTEIASIFNSLSLISFIQGQSKNNLRKSYDCLKQTMLDLSHIQRRQIVNCDIELKQYFKYLNNASLSIRDLHDNYCKAKDAFSKSNEKLKEKKEDYFNKGDVAKWELDKDDVDSFDYKNKPIAISKMLPRDTQKTNMLQLIYYYYANNCIDEFNRITDVFENETKKALDYFISAYKTIVTI